MHGEIHFESTEELAELPERWRVPFGVSVHGRARRRGAATCRRRFSGCRFSTAICMTSGSSTLPGMSSAFGRRAQLASATSTVRSPLSWSR